MGAWTNAGDLEITIQPFLAFLTTMPDGRKTSMAISTMEGAAMPRLRGRKEPSMAASDERSRGKRPPSRYRSISQALLDSTSVDLLKMETPQQS